MIQWVVEGVTGASLVERVIVATDDSRVFECVRGFGGEAVMTHRNVPSGTDRVAVAAREMDVDIVVNVQGDEPFISPEEVDAAVTALMEEPQIQVSTLAKRIYRTDELKNPDVVKVVVDERNHALYFSRSMIPFVCNGSGPEVWIKRHTIFKHVGIYGYRKSFLMEYAGWHPTNLEHAEKLEQLRVLEKGYKIKVAETTFEPFGVDTPNDLQRARDYASRRNRPSNRRE